eukprot:TRINITY_DN24632_c0_g1_i1.p1 TRINITY_DN24632_c0_g1~~TRINITY_DN24632_c0_g1_i1.p1  ORF type:complete len:277 (+),score=62.82 TRINITY_DN24632_c0_g1_i1:47-832(+)
MSGRSLSDVLAKGEELLKTWCPTEGKARSTSPAPGLKVSQRFISGAPEVYRTGVSVDMTAKEVAGIAERRLNEVEREHDLRAMSPLRSRPQSTRSIEGMVLREGPEDCIKMANETLEKMAHRHRGLNEDLLMIASEVIKEVGRNTSLMVDCKGDVKEIADSPPVYSEDDIVHRVAARIGCNIFSEVRALRESVITLHQEARVRIASLHSIQERTRHLSTMQSTQAADTSQLRTLITTLKPLPSRPGLQGRRLDPTQRSKHL